MDKRTNHQRKWSLKGSVIEKGGPFTEPTS